MAETKAGIQCQCKSYRCCWRPGFLPSFQLQILSADLRLREAMGIKQLGKFLKSSCASAMSHHSCASEYKAPELAEMINPWVVKVGFFMLVFAGTGILRIPGLPPCETHPNIELVLFQWASATQDESKVGGFKYFLNIFQLVSLGGSQSKISRYKTGHWVTNDCRMICFFFSSSGSSCCIGTKSIQQNPTRRPWWPLMWALASISVWLPLGREKVRKSFERPGNV